MARLSGDWLENQEKEHGIKEDSKELIEGDRSKNCP